MMKQTQRMTLLNLPLQGLKNRLWIIIYDQIRICPNLFFDCLTFLNLFECSIPSYIFNFIFFNFIFMKLIFNSQCYRSSTDGEMICLIVEVPQFIMIIIDGEPEETPKILNYYFDPLWHSRDGKDVALDPVSKYQKRFLFKTESN